jgi:ATP-binding cassette subfamily F protein uup
VVGLNGAGKSTLARILANLEAPDAGEVTRRRGSTVRYLAQAPDFNGDPTAEEVVAAGLGSWSAAVERHAALTQELSQQAHLDEALLTAQARAAEDVERLGGWDQTHKVRSMLEKLGVSRLSQAVSTLSGGERRRVALAQVLVAAPSLAILDEPTNHLDAETIEWLEQFLVGEYVGAILLVTHDRYLLNRVATRTLEISDGQIYSYDGGYEEYLEQKAERLAHAERAEQNRQNFLRGELDWLRRQPKARGTKQKARIERAEHALRRSAPRAEKTFRFEADVARQGKTLVELRNLSLSIADKRLVNQLDLIVTQGDRIGIIGRNGTGKTTLLRAITGEVAPSGGEVVLGQTVKVAYFDQERSDLELAKSVFDNIIGDQTQIELSGRSIEPYSYLERFGFKSSDQRQTVGSLSGGERARVALARLLRRSANLIILDEPTNDLDLASLSALEELLLEFSISALVVTHDRWFLDRTANAILAFEGDGKVVRYAGNYQALQQERLDNAKADGDNRRPRSTSGSARPKRSNALTWAEARELAGMLDHIERAEARVAELGEKLSRPETYDSPQADVAALTRELESARTEVESLTLRWEELETKKVESDSEKSK